MEFWLRNESYKREENAKSRTKNYNVKMNNLFHGINRTDNV